MTPVVDGTLHKFEARGLFNGLSLIIDLETGSIWDHLTGACVYGDLRGKRMPVGNLIQMNVAQALHTYPEIHVAISDREIRFNRWSPFNEDAPGLMPIFTGTIEEEDDRRDTMDIGLGVWTERTHRYYPVEGKLGKQGFVLDDIDGRRLLVLIEPMSNTPAAFYVDAEAATWNGARLALGTGDYFESGVLYNAAGERRKVDRPMQQFTRWYGFSLSFPGCEIYAE